jgi:Aminoglycoside-2''-adenylyltransferase
VLQRSTAEEAEDRDFYRWYGSWAPLRPEEVARLLDGLAVPWWIIGGWAIDAFTGVARDHEDVDVAFFRHDLPAVLERLAPDLCVWSNLSGTLRPLRKPEDLLEDARQLWVRRDGDSPWVMDLAMTPHEGDTWISPRDERVRMPLQEATFAAEDGLRYLRPELVLFMKARWERSKDDGDLERVVPLLDRASLARLRSWIELVHPDHRWLPKLR